MMEVVTLKYSIHETEHKNYFEIILGGKHFFFFSSDLWSNYVMFGFST